MALYEAGLLTEEEIAELRPFWRAEFDRANRADFFFVSGPGEYLTGKAAKRAHYKWACIPRAVLKELAAERALVARVASANMKLGRLGRG